MTHPLPSLLQEGLPDLCHLQGTSWKQGESLRKWGVRLVPKVLRGARSTVSCTARTHWHRELPLLQWEQHCLCLWWAGSSWAHVCLADASEKHKIELLSSKSRSGERRSLAPHGSLLPRFNNLASKIPPLAGGSAPLEHSFSFRVHNHM